MWSRPPIPYTDELIDRLPIIARLLLGDYADALAALDKRWLRRREEARDWIAEDVAPMREALPSELHFLLALGAQEHASLDVPELPELTPAEKLRVAVRDLSVWLTRVELKLSALIGNGGRAAAEGY
jgi:hypothetical protein